MRTKEEILDHLAHTVYTHKARKTIIERLKITGMVEFGDRIKFASHTYNRDGEQMTKGLDYDDFIYWYIDVDNYISETKRTLEDILSKPTFNPWINLLSSLFNYNADNIAQSEEYKNDKEDFQVGDWVKYIPEPGESYTEVVEAIAYNNDGRTFLCLSSGEYVSSAYCIKFKVQGEERMKLIDKLNATV